MHHNSLRGALADTLMSCDLTVCPSVPSKPYSTGLPLIYWVEETQSGILVSYEVQTTSGPGPWHGSV